MLYQRQYKPVSDVPYMKIAILATKDTHLSTNVQSSLNATEN